MPSQAPSEVAKILESAKDAYFFSGYQAVASHVDQIVSWQGGTTSYWPDTAPVTESTLFDIGSVTKAVVTTSLCALAVDQKRFTLDSKVGDWVEEWKTTRLGDVRVEDLLNHSSGLIAWAPFFKNTDATKLRSWMGEQAASWLQAGPCEQSIYSDVGFITLGEVMKEVWRTDLATAFEKHVCKPLGLMGVQYGPVRNLRSVVATEVREGKPVHGIVFDENSHGLGDKTAHAGLFSSARALLPWAQEWLKAVQGKSSWLSRQTAELFTTPPGKVKNSSWALGWDTRSPQGSSAGSIFSTASFGHLGYPGCSVWIDPRASMVAIFFSNRVHPSRLDERIRKLRPLLHDAIARRFGISK